MIDHLCGKVLNPEPDAMGVHGPEKEEMPKVHVRQLAGSQPR